MAIMIHHGGHGRTTVFNNRHRVEFAVFDANGVGSGKVERYRVLIDRDQIAELIAAVHENTRQQAQLRPDALENLCQTVWSACERFGRGELLSARHVDEFAVNKLLSLLSGNEPICSHSLLFFTIRCCFFWPDIGRWRNRVCRSCACKLLKN